MLRLLGRMGWRRKGFTRRGIFAGARSGQGLVEFALVVPILLLLVFGIIEFGRLMWILTLASASSREGARYAAAIGTSGAGPYYKDCTGIKAAATRIGYFAGVNPADITIKYTNLFNRTTNSLDTLSSCPVSWPSEKDVTLGSTIEITVKVHYKPLLLGGFVPPSVADGREFRTRRTLVAGVPIAQP